MKRNDRKPRRSYAWAAPSGTARAARLWGRLGEKKTVLLLLGLAAVLLVCLIKLTGYVVQNARARSEQKALQMQLAAAPAPVPAQLEQPVEAPAPAPAPTDQATPRAAAYGMVTPQPTHVPGQDQATGAFQLIGGEAQILPELQALYQRNHDLVGWLKIPGVVDLPVVYRDNGYYLYRNFDGQDSMAGTLFLDSLHPFQADTQQLVIHGHNMRDGTMFGHLTRYRKADFASKHSTITWKTLYRQETYEIFAVVLTNIDPKDARYIPYLGKARFKTAEKFQDLMDQYRAQSVYWRGLSVTPSDALLTLSTCIGDDRLLVVAKRTGI